MSKVLYLHQTFTNYIFDEYINGYDCIPDVAAIFFCIFTHIIDESDRQYLLQTFTDSVFIQYTYFDM